MKITWQSKLRITGAVLLALTHSIPMAQQLGSYGNEWSIQEQDGVEQLLDKLKGMEEEGTLRQLQEQYRDDYLDKLENPSPIPGISVATESREYHIDPSITVSENVRDEKGRIIVYAGTRINPFEHLNWTKSVVLIDARYEDQVDWAKKHLDNNQNDKVILVGGSYLDLMRKWEKRVFYDVAGGFTSRFNLTTVPAIISQDGLKLRVQELDLREIQ